VGDRGTIGEALEALYLRFNRPEFVPPDPLEFVLPWRDLRDREVTGLLASSLAFGRVVSIRRSVGFVLELLGDRPARTLSEAPPGAFDEALASFVHRFVRGSQVSLLLGGIGRVLREAGSLEALIRMRVPRDDSDLTIRPALSGFVEALRAASGLGDCFLLPRGGARKRMHLFLRWMVRRDVVDPGGWEIDPARLLVPLDTHLFRIGRRLGMLTRSTPDEEAARELTDSFRTIRPDDPVRYDFALTRFGIRPDLAADPLFVACGLISAP
jgi:uncharacterized protein (TIGR02757 family)